MPQGAEISRILVSLAFLTVVVVEVEVVEAVVVVVVVSRFWRCSYQYAEASTAISTAEYLADHLPLLRSQRGFNPTVPTW